jgi:hypothetical protein
MINMVAQDQTRPRSRREGELPTRNHPPVRPPRDAVELAVDVLSDPWTFLILREAFFGVRRYGEMQRQPRHRPQRPRGAAAEARRRRHVRPRALLHRPGLVRVPSHRAGARPYPVIVGLMTWAQRHLDPDDEAALDLVHTACGQPADPYLACSHCHEPVTARDVVPTVA